MTSTIGSTRPTEAMCPPWCAGHDGTYQGWETTRNGGAYRPHDDDQHVSIGGVSVILTQRETPAGMEPAKVMIGDNSPGMVGYSDLSDGDAHELGLAIVRAADRVRRYRLEQEAGR